MQDAEVAKSLYEPHRRDVCYSQSRDCMKAQSYMLSGVQVNDIAAVVV